MVLFMGFIQNNNETQGNASINISWSKLHNFLPWSITAKALSTIFFVMTLQICRPKQEKDISFGAMGGGARLELKIPFCQGNFGGKKPITHLGFASVLVLGKNNPQNYSIPPAMDGFQNGDESVKITWNKTKVKGQNWQPPQLAALFFLVNVIWTHGTQPPLVALGCSNLKLETSRKTGNFGMWNMLGYRLANKRFELSLHKTRSPPAVHWNPGTFGVRGSKTNLNFCEFGCYWDGEASGKGKSY